MGRRLAGMDPGDEWAATERQIAADLERYRGQIAELLRQLREIGPDLHRWEYRNGQLMRKAESTPGSE